MEKNDGKVPETIETLRPWCFACLLCRICVYDSHTLMQRFAPRCEWSDFRHIFTWKRFSFLGWSRGNIRDGAENISTMPTVALLYG